MFVLISVGYNVSGKPMEALIGRHFPFCWNFGWQRVVRIPCRQVIFNFKILISYFKFIWKYKSSNRLTPWKFFIQFSKKKIIFKPKTFLSRLTTLCLPF